MDKVLLDPVYDVSSYGLSEKDTCPAYKYAEFYTDTLAKYRVELYSDFNQYPYCFNIVYFNNKGLPLKERLYLFTDGCLERTCLDYLKYYRRCIDTTLSTTAIDTIAPHLPEQMNKTITDLLSKGVLKISITTYYYEESDSIPSLITCLPPEKSKPLSASSTCYYAIDGCSYTFLYSYEDDYAYLYVDGKLDCVYELFGAGGFKRKFLYNTKGKVFEIFDFFRNANPGSYNENIRRNKSRNADFANCLAAYIRVYNYP